MPSSCLLRKPHFAVPLGGAEAAGYDSRDPLDTFSRLRISHQDVGGTGCYGRRTRPYTRRLQCWVLPVRRKRLSAQQSHEKVGLQRFEEIGCGILQEIPLSIPGPAFAGSALLVITANLPSSVTLVDRRIYGWMGAGYGVLLLIVIITFSVEAFLSYAILGSYGSAFHRLDVPRERSRVRTHGSSDSRANVDQPIVTEMIAYGGILVTGYVAMSSTMYFLSQRLGGFAYIPEAHGTTFVQPASLFDALYWTAIIPADLNGAGPVGAFPRIIVLLAFIAAFVMVTFVVFILGIAMASVLKPLSEDSRHLRDNTGKPTHPESPRTIDADKTRTLPQGRRRPQRSRRTHKRAG
jgi:hypothetical protein